MRNSLINNTRPSKREEHKNPFQKRSCNFFKLKFSRWSRYDNMILYKHSRYDELLHRIINKKVFKNV